MAAEGFSESPSLQSSEGRREREGLERLRQAPAKVCCVGMTDSHKPGPPMYASSCPLAHTLKPSFWVRLSTKIGSHPETGTQKNTASSDQKDVEDPSSTTRRYLFGGPYGQRVLPITEIESFHSSGIKIDVGPAFDQNREGLTPTGRS